MSPRTSSLPNRKAMAPFRHLASDDSATELKTHQRQYLRRKAAGKCTATGCPNDAKPGHTKCRAHLASLSQRHKKRYVSRSGQGLCIYCGERPQFWGVRCVICRQRFFKEVLPSAARKALHGYVEAEKKRDIEHAQVEARFQARKLLLGDRLTAVQAQALRLFVGDDNGSWRTYDEVARLMRVSKQRVHQALSASRAEWDIDNARSKRPLKPVASQRATRQQKVYRKRRAEGLCGYGRCAKQAAPGHAQCEEHLQKMLKRAVERREERKQQKLCVECGKLPQFWGNRCIMCRTEHKNPLPYAARRALRRYRQAEAKREAEKCYHQLRAATVRLLTSNEVKGKSAEALRLWVGLDRKTGRSYRQVGALIGLSGERVRQLLVPSRLILKSLVSNSLARHDAGGRLKPSTAFVPVQIKPERWKSASSSHKNGNPLM